MADVDNGSIVVSAPPADAAASAPGLPHQRATTLASVVKDPALTVYGIITAAVYVLAWLRYADFGRGSSLRLPFLLGALFIVTACFGLALCCGNTQAAVGGMIGAGAFFVSLVLHHPSTHIVILGSAYSLSLLLVLGREGGLVSEFTVFLFLLAVFGTCYISCQKPIVALFGGGRATTLYGVVLFALLALIYRLDLAPPTATARLTLLTIPVTIMSTSHPDYLSDKPSRVHRGVTLLCILALIAFWMLNAQVPIFSLVVVLGPAVTTAVAIYTRWRPAVLGPFYSFERRASALCLIAVALLAIDVASREEALSLDGHLKLPLPSFTSSSEAGGFNRERLYSKLHNQLNRNVPPLLPDALVLKTGDPIMSYSLLYTTAGFAFCQLLFAVLCMVSELLSAHSASLRVFRSGWLLMLSILTALCAVMSVSHGFLMANIVRPGVSALSWVLQNTPGGQLLKEERFRALLPLEIGFWPKSWHAALACAALFSLSTFAMQYLAQSSPLMAPLVANVVLRRQANVPPRRSRMHLRSVAAALSPTSAATTPSYTGLAEQRQQQLMSSVALTFNGLPSERQLTPLLVLLAQFNAKSTFFVDAAAAKDPASVAIIDTLLRDGHEIGCLGLAGAHWTSETLADITATRDALQQRIDEFHRRNSAPAGRSGEYAGLSGSSDGSFGGGSVHAPTLHGHPLSVATGLATTMSSAVSRHGGGGSRSRASSPGFRQHQHSSNEAVTANGSSSSSSSPRGKSRSRSPGAHPPVSPALHVFLPKAQQGSMAEVPITSTLQRRVTWYRPQDGSRDVTVLRAANLAGLKVALWSATPYDWCVKKGQVRERLLDQLVDSKQAPGSIIQLHLSLPDWLQAPKAALWPEHDPLSVARETLDLVTREWRLASVPLTMLLMGRYQHLSLPSNLRSSGIGDSSNEDSE